MLDWAYAAATFVDDQATFESAHTATGFIDLVTKFDTARLTIAIDVQCTAWWTDTYSIYVTDVALVNAT